MRPDGHAAPPIPPSDGGRDAILRGQAGELARNGITGAAMGYAGALCMAAGLAYTGIDLLRPLLVWLACLLPPYIAHVALCRRAKPADAADDPAATRRFARRMTLATGAEGVIWGIGFVVFADLGTIEQELLALLLGAGVAAGAAMSLGAYLPAFRARFFAATLPYAAWALVRGDGLHILLALIVLLFSLAIGRLAAQFSLGFSENLRLRFANAALAEELRAERDAAERASLEKSRFLAAASHDLRQPVHALGMFVGALRHGMQETARQAVLDQVTTSLEAMDGLFASLLDLSRLDAGVIEPQPRAFALQPLLARLCAEYAPEAGARGVALRLVPTGAVVRTDPALLERMLRNLIANAVRYTDAGRVLVGVRRDARAGARRRIEVWDTGPGIAEVDQSTVFEEFAQLANPERARGKGLGLGLAIVRRLSHLIDCPVTLRSRPGRGSVFSVAVPAAVAVPLPAPAPVAGSVVTGATLLLIEDDPAARAAMTALLTGWGHVVRAAADAAEALEAATGDPARAASPPDLLICDFRLPGPLDGIATVAALRAALHAAGGPATLPALLVSGDTGPEQLRRAKASGLPLLHKPVSPARLRAAIGNLLAHAAAA